MYHNISPHRPRKLEIWTVSPKAFRRQMHWLARRGYTGISARQWSAWRRSSQPLPPKPVVLTFDDAYQDIAEYALPVLREFGFRATVFVVTRSIGKTNLWDEPSGFGTLRIMSAGQIHQFADQGIEFGSHTRTHPRLTALDPDAMKAEVAGSRLDLAEILGAPPTSFAYPYGDFDEQTKECVARSYSVAFTTQEGLNSIHTDRNALYRTPMWPDTWLAEMPYKLRSGTDRLRDLRLSIRRTATSPIRFLATPLSSKFARRIHAE